MALEQRETMTGFDNTILAHLAGSHKHSDDHEIMKLVEGDFARAVADVLINPTTADQPLKVLQYATRYLECASHAEKREIITLRIEEQNPDEAARSRSSYAVSNKREKQNLESDQTARRIGLEEQVRRGEAYEAVYTY